MAILCPFNVRGAVNANFCQPVLPVVSVNPQGRHTHNHKQAAVLYGRVDVDEDSDPEVTP